MSGITVHGPASGPRGLVGTTAEEHWRLLFTALVAKVQGTACRCPVALTWQEIEAARSLLLVEWPMVGPTLDFTAARQDGSMP